MGDEMKSSIKARLAAGGFAALALSPANAYEAISASTKPGAFIGSSAGVPPPGIYMFNQVFTYQANFTGPGTTSLGLGNHASVHANDYTMGFLFVPGWTFLAQPTTPSSCSRGWMWASELFLALSLPLERPAAPST